LNKTTNPKQKLPAYKSMYYSNLLGQHHIFIKSNILI